MDKYPLIGVSICIVVLLILGLMTPITQVVDCTKINKETKYRDIHWGKIIEAHCDIRYTQYTNDSHGALTIKYFVFGIGRHTISIDFEDDIYWQEGSWNNNTYGTGDHLSLFRPIAKRTVHSSTDGFGDFIFGICKMTLSVDGVVMDSEYCIFPIHIP